MKEKTRIAVLVSGGGTNLQALIDAQGSVLTDGTINLVVSNKDGAFALERAKKAGIAAYTINKSKCGGQAEFEKQLCDLLDGYDTELIVLAGFLSILSKDFTDRYKDRIINIHPSLIPSFCGAGFYGLKVHEAALDYGVKVTGATVHFVNEIPDGGRIIMQRAVDIHEDDTPETLQKRVMEEAEWKILPEAVQKISAEIRKNRG